MSGQLWYGIPTQVQTLNGFRMGEERQRFKARILEIFLTIILKHTAYYFPPLGSEIEIIGGHCKVVRCTVQVRGRVGEGNLFYASCKNIYFLNTQIFFQNPPGTRQTSSPLPRCSGSGQDSGTSLGQAGWVQGDYGECPYKLQYTINLTIILT